MKIKCNREVLAAAVKDLAAVAGPAGPTACILSRINGSILELTATNLEVAVARSVFAECGKRGADRTWLMPARRLSGVLAADWSEHVMIEPRDGGADLYLDGGKVRLPGPDVTTYPDVPMPAPGAAHGARVKPKALREHLSRAMIAVGRTSAPQLDGVYVEFAGDQVAVFGTDEHRLIISGDWEDLSGENERASAIVSPPGVRQIISLCDRITAEDDEIEWIVRLNVTNSVLHAWNSNDAVTVRLISGVYPDCRRIIRDTGRMMSAYVNPRRLLGAVDVLSAAEDRYAKIRIRAADSAIELSTDGEGSGVITVSADVRGECELSVSACYLRDMVKLAKPDGEGLITIHACGRLDPVVNRADDFYHMVMPIEE